MARLSILLLGSPQILLDGVPVTHFESDKVRALLAYLAVERDRPHRREALSALLWPDYAESTARASLRNALFNLRSVIGDRIAQPPYLLIDPQTIQFNADSDHVADAPQLVALMAPCERHENPHPEECEACRDRLEQAVALYRGDFLEGFSLEDSEPYEEWATLQREHLRHLALLGLERLAVCYEHRLEYDRALEIAWRHLELDPLQEQVHRLVMRLLALSGRRSEALAHYQTCQRILREELDIAPDAETVALLERIRSGSLVVPPQERPAIASSAPERSMSTAPPEGQVVPRRTDGLPDSASTTFFPSRLHQLPPPPADFVGRENELRQLVDAVEHQNVRILGIRGLGGIGKTALALVLARQLAESFADAQFYIEMRGTDQRPLDPLQAMAHIVRSIYPLAGLPPDDAALLALYRSVLWGQRALILLDNVRDRAQVEPLLPPDSCLLVVTSRWRFTLPGLHPLDLEGQPLEQAILLLRTLVPRITGEEAEDLARACGGLPLALRVAGGALAERDDLPLADYLKTLRAAMDKLPRELEPVESSLSASDGLLEETLRSRWYALSVFPDSFDRAAAAAV